MNFLRYVFLSSCIMTLAWYVKVDDYTYPIISSLVCMSLGVLEYSYNSGKSVIDGYKTATIRYLQDELEDKKRQIRHLMETNDEANFKNILAPNKQLIEQLRKQYELLNNNYLRTREKNNKTASRLERTLESLNMANKRIMSLEKENTDMYKKNQELKLYNNQIEILNNQNKNLKNNLNHFEDLFANTLSFIHDIASAGKKSDDIESYSEKVVQAFIQLDNKIGTGQITQLLHLENNHEVFPIICAFTIAMISKNEEQYNINITDVKRYIDTCTKRFA
jgi:chromosome segregation ATPase